MMFLLLLLFLQTGRAQTKTISYIYTAADMANPERGWYDAYHSSGSAKLGTYRNLDSTELKNQRVNDNITLIYRQFMINDYLYESAIGTEYLEAMQKDFDAARAAGVKVIVRFSYSDSQNDPVWDATPEIVMSHIESLRGVLQTNSDVIATVQAGFVGAWGEWYYTVNFAGSGYVPNETDQANRRALVKALLDILPDNIQVQVRTPAIKRNIVESNDPMLDEQAYDGSYISRIAPHNDCFLANGTDYGTYVSLSADLAYLAQDTKYAIAGGETCDGSNSYSNCDAAIPRMEMLHWTFLNRDYNKTVYNKWETQGCMNEANIRLGYRLALQSAVLPDTLDAGQTMTVVLNLENRGFAAPTQYKPLQVVLVHAVTGEVTELGFTGENDDVRFWGPGEFSVSGTVALPAELADGNYRVYLKFPDQYVSVRNNPAYSIRLANAGAWDQETGCNDLNYMLVIGNGGEGAFPGAPSSLMASVFSYSRIDLTWTAGENSNETEIYRCITGLDDWQLVTTLSADVLSFQDEGLRSSTSYSYMIRSVNDYGYSAWSEIITAATPVGTSDRAAETAPLLYPNPYRCGDLYIGMDNSGPSTVVIADQNGRIVAEKIIEGTVFHIDQPGLQPGIYFVRVDNEVRRFTRKLVVI